MHRLSALLLLACPVAALAQNVPEPPPPPEPVRELPPRFSCAVNRESPLGTLGAQQSVSPSGVADDPIYSWTAFLSPRGIAITTAWIGAHPADHSFVQLSYNEPEPDMAYRFRVQRDVPNGQSRLLFQSEFTRPEGGVLNVFTDWGPLTGILSRAADPRILLLDANGAAIRSEQVDPEDFDRAVAAAVRLQPELDALVADYRNRCPFVERTVFPD